MARKRKKRVETPQQVKARIAKAQATKQRNKVAALKRVVLTDQEIIAAVAGIPMQEKALREQILTEGLALTMGDRNKAYGDPLRNFELTASLKNAFWCAMMVSNKEVQQNSPFGHAIDMVFTNLARIATSPTTHLERDRFVDMANYAAIAYEVGMRSSE